MTNNISLTIPLNHSALIRSSEMLAALAKDLVSPITTEEQAEAAEIDTVAAAVAKSITTTEPDAKAVFASKPPAAEPTAETTAPPESEPETPADTTQAPANSVDLDADGLPWDERIHSASKTKLKKTEQWKKKRGVDDATVEAVEAELRAVMAIPAGTPAAETPTSAPPPPAAPTQEQAAADPTDATPPAAPAAITTFPQLMTAITKAGLDQATITAGLQKVGLPALPVVATRPDLIPQLSEALGL